MKPEYQKPKTQRQGKLEERKSKEPKKRAPPKNRTHELTVKAPPVMQDAPVIPMQVPVPEASEN